MLLTTKEVAAILRCGEKGARSWLKGQKLVPVDLGRGRGKGLRWYKSEVVAALNGSRVATTPKRTRNLGMEHNEAMAFFGATADLTNRFVSQ